MTDTHVLELENCSKSFPGVQALQRVDLELASSEIHCIVGENGAGKSTLIKILSGALRPDEGVIRVAEGEFSELTPHQAQEFGIRTIYQEISLVPELTVAENIFSGRELSRGPGIIDYKAMRKEGQLILESLHIELDVSLPVKALGSAQMQFVQMAKAFAQDARVLILDEPTASCSASEIGNLIKTVQTVADAGTSVVYISHHLDEVLEIHGKITVLRDGRKVATHERGEVNEAQIAREMIGRDVSSFYLRQDINPDADKTLELSGYSDGRTVHDVSLNVHAGEIVGLAGMVGSGRTEFVRLVFGADRRVSGSATINGEEIGIRHPQDAVRAGFALLTEDRKHDGLVLDHSVTSNVSIVHLCTQPGGFIHEKKEEEGTEHYVEALSVRTPSVKQIARNLSGGNQQKVVLAKWLYADARVIIFDEPTRGIDVGAKEEIYRLMVDLARRGKFILMVTSDMPELIAMCDRVFVMRKGRIAAEIDRENLDSETVLTHSIGGTI